MEVREAVKELDNIFLKYNIKDEKNILGFRNNFIEYVRTLNEKNLKEEYEKRQFLYEFVELQKQIGIERDLLSEYTMMVAVNSKNLKQCFTPFEATIIMSKLTTKVDNNTFYDCAAGTGQTLIEAYCDWCKLQKHYDDTLFHLVVEEDKYYIALSINDNIKRDDYDVYMLEVIPKTVGQYAGLDNKKRKSNMGKRYS